MNAKSSIRGGYIAETTIDMMRKTEHRKQLK